MVNPKIPKEFDQKVTRRYRRHNMTKAMRGRIQRGLVELITNSDDSYRDQEDNGVQASGKIVIEIERKRGNRVSLVRVKDRACGMSSDELYQKIGVVGDRTSGFEKGKQRRGLYGRGAKDVAIFGPTCFESIKDDKYSCLLIQPDLVCIFKNRNQKVTSELRNKLGIVRGNGTVVSIEVEPSFSIPQHASLGDS